MTAIDSSSVFPRDILFCYEFAICGACWKNTQGICIYVHDWPCDGSCHSNSGMTLVRLFKKPHKWNHQACPKYRTELFM